MSAVSQMAMLGISAGGGGNDSFTKVLLHMEGANAGTSFPDSNAGGSAHTWTATSATTSTTLAKFGLTSESCGAGAGHIQTADSADFTLGSGAWTIDFWFNRQGGDGTRRFATGQIDNAGATGSFLIELTAANVVRGAVYKAGAQTSVTGSTSITTTGWHHVAFVRTGDILRLFVDGTQEGGDVAFTGSVDDSAEVLSVGRGGALASIQWNGFIDEYRMSVGVARWTSSFTPPTGTYF